MRNTKGKAVMEAKSELLYIVITALLVAGIVFLILILRECRSGTETGTSGLKIVMSISPDKGIEPIVANISIVVESTENKKIEYVKIDLDGDGKFDIERNPNEVKYSENLTFEYVAPEEISDESAMSVTSIPREFYYPVTPCVEAKSVEEVKKECKTINIIPTGKPKFDLIASTCSGPPPLVVNFKVEMVEKIYDEYTLKWDCDGDGEFEKEGKDFENTCTFEVSGLYPSKVSISAPNKKYSISKYMYCGRISPGLISKYIEVLSEKVIPHKFLSLSSLRILDHLFQAQNGDGTGDKLRMLFGGNPGLLLIDGGKIADFLGIFFSPFVEQQVLDIQDSRVPTFPFNVFHSKFWGNKIFITSDSGTYIGEKSDSSPQIKLRKLTDSQIGVFPFPLSDPKIFLGLDILKGDILRCQDEELKICETQRIRETSEGSSIILETEYKYIVSSDNQVKLILFVMYADGFKAVITFDGENITIKDVSFLIPNGVKIKLGRNRIYVLENDASIGVKILDLSGDQIKEQTISRENDGIFFTSVEELDENTVLLGLIGIPCPNTEVLKGCNLSLYDMNKRKFYYLEGEGNISDFLFQREITKYKNKETKKVKEIYILKSDGEVDVSEISFIQDNIFSTNLSPAPFGIPSPPIRDINTGVTDIFLVTQKTLLNFTSSGYFLGSFYISEGFIDKVARAGGFIFIGISDDITTSGKGEGNFIVLNNKFEKIKEYKDDEIPNSIFSCLHAEEDALGGIMIFACVGTKMKILEFNTNNFEVRQRCEAELGEHGVDVKYFNGSIFVATNSRILTFDTNCGKISEEKALVQIFQIDVDSERKLLFSAEGGDHSFRIWSIDKGFPEEVTRFSLDYGVEGDAASGVAHLGRTLFIASTHTSLLIFDTNDPKNPKLLRKVWITENFGSLMKCSAVEGEKEIACLTPGGSPVLFFR